MDSNDQYQEWNIEYGHIEQCGGYVDYKVLIKGCFDKYNRTIMLVEEYMWDQTMYGMTIWEHEIRHAMGMSHAEMEWWYFKGQYR